VIPKLENADWRHQALAKRKRAYLPEGSSSSGNVQEENTVNDEIDESRVGLQITKRAKVEETITTDQEEGSLMDIDADTATMTTAATTTTTVVTEETIDEIAARKIVEGKKEKKSNTASVFLQGCWIMKEPYNIY